MKNWLNAEGKFQSLKSEEVNKLSAEELGGYWAAKAENDAQVLKDNFAEVHKSLESTVSKEELEAQKKELNTAVAELEKHAVTLKAMKEEASAKGTTVDEFKKQWEAQKEAIAGIKQSKGIASMELKATQTYGDITSGEDFAQMRPGVVDQPVRQPKFRNLFATIPLNTEFYKYTEQTSVIRDAQNVALCTAVTSTTKEELTVASIGTKVIKDMMDFCIDFVEDYPFMRNRINKLINESLVLRADQQILLGTGLGEETKSIDSVSSEFSAANPACVLTTSIQAANFVDLILGMETQIIELGQQNDFMPNYAVVNHCDWFKLVTSLKDLDNNYLDTRIRMNGNRIFIGNMEVITSPIVAANTCYVFDSTKGEIIDRKRVTVDIAFQNRDNWEKEIGTIKGYERINFLVPSELANAFMKCSDVAAAITAITAI